MKKILPAIFFFGKTAIFLSLFYSVAADWVLLIPNSNELEKNIGETLITYLRYDTDLAD